ncbi:MAG: preprotein translocase subunit SecE [Patescibacteria group bacterium]
MSEKSSSSSKRNPVVAYFSSAWEEFGKVTWPTKEQAALLTAIVVAVSFVMAVLIGAFDLGLSELYKLVLDKISQQ